MSGTWYTRTFLVRFTDGGDYFTREGVSTSLGKSYATHPETGKWHEIEVDSHGHWRSVEEKRHAWWQEDPTFRKINTPTWAQLPAPQPSLYTLVHDYLYGGMSLVEFRAAAQEIVSP